MVLPGSNGSSMTPEQARQLGQDIQELGRQAGGMRPLLADEPELGKLAQELVNSMQKLDGAKGDRKIDDLAASLIDRWKELELRLSRKLDGDKNDPVRLSGQERVPEKYRSILEEYYRSLSKTPR
jgi:hypothetical protein